MPEETERLLGQEFSQKDKTLKNEQTLLADPDEGGAEAANAEVNRSLRSSEYARIAMQR